MATKNQAQHAVVRAEAALADGDLADAKSALEAAYRYAFSAYPMKWAQEIIAVDLSRLRAQLRRCGVEISRPGEALKVKNPKASRRPGKRRPFQAQDLLFRKDKWTVIRAKAWAKKNGHRYGDVSETSGFIHLKQHSAAEYQKGTLHNIEIAKNVEATVGIPRTESDAAASRGYGTRGPRQGKLFSARSRVVAAATADPDDFLY